MKLITKSCVFAICLVTGLAQADTPPVLDTYNCSYLPGKDASDLDSAVEFWQQQVDKLPEEAMMGQYQAWIVTPIRSTAPYDVHWLGASQNVSVWAKGGAAYAASKEGQAADERFSKVMKCTSASWAGERIYGEPPAEDATSGVMEGFGCSLLPGKTMSNVRAVEENWSNEAKAAGLDMRVVRMTPMYTDGQVDLIYLVGYDSMDAYADNTTKAMTTAATAQANWYFNLVMDCGAGFYSVDKIK